MRPSENRRQTLYRAASMFSGAKHLTRSCERPAGYGQAFAEHPELGTTHSLVCADADLC